MSPHQDPQLEVRALEIAGLLKASCDRVKKQTNRDVGFVLLLYDHGPGGFLSYMSNSERGDVVKLMKEFIDKAESGQL